MGTFNQRQAWRISDLLDRELRELHDAGWRPSHVARPKLDALVERYADAQERADFEAWTKVCAKMLEIARADFKAWERRELASRNGHARENG